MRQPDRIIPIVVCLSPSCCLIAAVFANRTSMPASISPSTSQ